MLLLDRIESSGYSVDALGVKQHFRMALVTGVSTVNPAAVCYQATVISGMPQFGDAHPVHPSCRVVGIEAVGILESSDTVKVLIRYSDPTTKQQPVGGGRTWIIEDDLGLTGDTSQLVPGPNKKPLLLKYKDPKTSKITEYQGSVSYHRPIRTVTLSGSTGNGVDLDAVRASVGRVNADKWGGLGVGYWLMTGLRTRTADAGRTYSVSVQMVTRSTEDWSEYVFLRDRNSDQYVTVKESDLTSLTNTKYSYGISRPSGNEFAGIMSVGPYEAIPFGPIFT